MLLARLEFQRGGQNDRMTEYRMTERTKTICLTIFDLWGIKINIITTFRLPVIISQTVRTMR